jgi:hypothetical protein
MFLQLRALQTRLTQAVANHLSRNISHFWFLLFFTWWQWQADCQFDDHEITASLEGNQNSLQKTAA